MIRPLRRGMNWVWYRMQKGHFSKWQLRAHVHQFLLTFKWNRWQYWNARVRIVEKSAPTRHANRSAQRQSCIPRSASLPLRLSGWSQSDYKRNDASKKELCWIRFRGSQRTFVKPHLLVLDCWPYAAVVQLPDQVRAVQRDSCDHQLGHSNRPNRAVFVGFSRLCCHWFTEIRNETWKNMALCQEFLWICWSMCSLMAILKGDLRGSNHSRGWSWGWSSTAISIGVRWGLGRDGHWWAWHVESWPKKGLGLRGLVAKSECQTISNVGPWFYLLFERDMGWFQKTVWLDPLWSKRKVRTKFKMSGYDRLWRVTPWTTLLQKLPRTPWPRLRGFWPCCWVSVCGTIRRLKTWNHCNHETWYFRESKHVWEVMCFTSMQRSLMKIISNSKETQKNVKVQWNKDNTTI